MTNPNDPAGREESADQDEWTAVNLPDDQPQQPAYPPPPQPPVAPVPPGYDAAGGYPPPAPGYPTSGYPAAPTPDPYAAAYGYPAYPAGPAKTNGMAIGSLVTGLLGLGCCFPAPIAILLGILALQQAGQDPAPNSADKPMAWVGIGLGAFAILFFFVVIGLR
ncbi:MAG: DUF4190 domain-containing protein [Gordonia sp. (in: high G+C Gram-positive bacteria)]|uniref:DUF4190 domain-containing protein n=1 Tax=Gordonia sp. (in: high G+C Gram-positive bacteria) TaxID=84139 RepID=UPI0039E5DA66